MTITESRVKNGSLTLKSTVTTPVTLVASCQATNVKITPGFVDNKEDALEMLCGYVKQPTASSTPSDTLDIGSVQDFTNPAGLIAFSWAHRGETVEFTWKPNGSIADVWTGTLTIDKPIEVGGEVNKLLTADVSWPVVTLKPPTGFGTGYGSAVKGAAKPGDVFPAEATVTASDATNAAKLTALGYVASPTTAWTTGQKITVGTYDFNWSGTAWAAGAHALSEEPAA